MTEKPPARPYTINGRRWLADDPEHAIEQHSDAFPDELVDGTPLLTAEASRDYVVTVQHTTPAEAAQVMAERLGYDDDYGFPYTIDYANADALPVSITVCDDTAVLPVSVFRSDSDDALVIQLDTDAARGRIRIYLNDGAVYDGDPEYDENAVLITTGQIRQWAGEPVTEELVAGIRAAIARSSIPDAIAVIADAVRERHATTDHR